jgi:hypothetical protein
MNATKLRAALAGTPHCWLDAALEMVVWDPGTIGRLLPAAGRRCGRAALSTMDDWTTDDAARVLLICALPLRGAPLAAEVRSLYRFGDAHERRAVLRALPLLDERDAADPALVGVAVPLLLDAIRSNDTRLVGAALGPYARHLDAHSWRQAVLKCVFTGVPLSVVADLDTRADTELARMLGALAVERYAAGRTMPADATALLDRLTGAGPAAGRAA